MSRLKTPGYFRTHSFSDAGLNREFDEIATVLNMRRLPSSIDPATDATFSLGSDDAYWRWACLNGIKVGTSGVLGTERLQIDPIFTTSTLTTATFNVHGSLPDADVRGPLAFKAVGTTTPSSTNSAFYVDPDLAGAGNPGVRVNPVAGTTFVWDLFNSSDTTFDMRNSSGSAVCNLTLDGTLTVGGLTLPSQLANRFLASPDGVPGVPTFRNIVLGDITELLALSNLTDVTGVTGTGTTVVMSGSPTIVTPTIASFANATHGHTTAAGGGTLDAAAIASGTLGTARLGSGSASVTTLLRGDQSWATSISAFTITTLTSGAITNAGDLAITLTGAAPRTLTLENTTAGQVANLNLVDGALFTGGTQRLSNAGALSNITTISMSGNLTTGAGSTVDTVDVSENFSSYFETTQRKTMRVASGVVDTGLPPGSASVTLGFSYNSQYTYSVHVTYGATAGARDAPSATTDAANQFTIYAPAGGSVFWTTVGYL